MMHGPQSPPLPSPGDVMRFCYLWACERGRGLEDGKERPCIVVGTYDHPTAVGLKMIIMAAITHVPQDPGTGLQPNALPIPAQDKAAMGLDDRPSWLVTSEINLSCWPGYDWRRCASGPSPFVQGKAPRALAEAAGRIIGAQHKAGSLRQTDRTPNVDIARHVRRPR